MNKEYNLKLDLQFRCNNSKMIFDEFDENTSDFFIQISRQGQEVDISNAIPTLLVLKPSGTAVSQILNIKDNLIYGNLENLLKDEVGTYIAKLMLVEGDKKTFISNISYEVTENALLGKIDNDIVEDERYSVLLQLLERLSNIELQEQTRIDNENSRVEAENLRQEAIEKIKNDIDNLINETKEELNKYKENKDKFINDDLKEFKENTNKSIENYKTSKDIEINNSLNTYKTNTTNDINNFKNTVNSKIDKYKNDKDKAINEYIEGKSLELDNYVEAKNNELDLYVSEKNILIDSKISEVDNAKTQMQDSVNNKLIEVDNAEKQRQEEHEERQQFLNGFEGKLNTVVDDVATIKDDVVSAREANKRQDVFLQGLYNENLDGRVTVKEEGSVISLTNSDNGLVDIIGLEGNTLVNYCTDGAKELILNGDIDVEGTNVTLTEGVDNGLVDVVCEGNTMVNSIGDIPPTNNTAPYGVYNGFHLSVGTVNTWNAVHFRNTVKKANTTYTYVVYVDDIVGNVDLRGHISETSGAFKHIVLQKGLNLLTFTTNNISGQFYDDYVGFKPTECLEGCYIKIRYIMLLEGDWTNKEIPEYFEGMKSVGECEDNKIEIVSRNKNLFVEDLINETGVGNSANGSLYPSMFRYSDTRCRTENPIKVKPNTTYYFSSNDKFCLAIAEFDRDNKHILENGWTIDPQGGIYTTSNNCVSIVVVIRKEDNSKIKPQEIYGNIQIEEGVLKTTYIEPKLNKKEISLTEPLRALLNGVKDKIVKIGGKWYVERNCRQITLDGSENWRNGRDFEYTSNLGKYILPLDYNEYFSDKNNLPSFSYNEICDTFPTGKSYWSVDETGLYLGKTNSDITISFASTHALYNKTNEEFKQWLQANPTTIIYQLATPTYEEITDPTLNTYNDITHISNNSTIPCNMQVKNTGYNAIIKPSTQYTVAFDTDKGGEVGINLAGSKVTTNNNVATVTTPSTLVDDSLRLTGKGINASNIRLLEGDKTNYIPSYFEGMKSCFEDKLQDNGTYKIEITSTNTDNTLSSKIQFSSIEPLRGVGGVKDRFVFNKDGKLMIERNCGTYTFNGVESVTNWGSVPSNGYTVFVIGRGNTTPNIYLKNTYQTTEVKVDIFPQGNVHHPYRCVQFYGDWHFCIPLSELKENTTNAFKEWLIENNAVACYQLATPTYEEMPHELQKIILEGYENGTLFFDTNIPPTVEASYTANIPVVSKLNKVNETTEINTEDIAITQMAVDFLLMSTLGEEMLNFKLKSGYNMASYFASRIIKGALKYEDVINKYPQYKEDINSILISEGHSDLIIEL